MDPSTILVSAITAAATGFTTKAIDGPANTFNLLWKISFGRWDSKMDAMVRRRAEKYAEAIDNELGKIPKENLNKEPDAGVVGPALEAVKYYVDKEEIRRMFAKLIAAELDITKADKVQRSFVEIIKQMSSNDAKLLQKLPETGPLGDIRFISEDGKLYRSISGGDVIYISGSIEDNFYANTVSLSNLSRLGLLELNHVLSLVEGSVYEPYKKLEMYQKGLTDIQNGVTSFKKVEIRQGSYVLTPLGILFRSICLSPNIGDGVSVKVEKRG